MKYLVPLALLAVFLLAVPLGSADVPSQYIDYNQCVWKKGSAAEKVQCDDGWVGTGACGNKGQNQCDGKAFALECCKMRNSTITGACHEKSGSKGKNIGCDGETVLFGTCGSLDMSRCNHNGDLKCITLNCCPTSLPVNYGSCGWKWAGSQGQNLQCNRHAGSEQVLRGRCGSETMAACDGSKVHGIYCCDLA